MEKQASSKATSNELRAMNYKPADRLSGVSEYYFSRKLKEVAEMNAQGMDVISLGIGSPDMPPSEETIHTLCQAANNPDGHGYMPYVGIPELRQAFADWYRRWYGVELDPKTEIQPLIGSKEGILHVTLAFVNPGDRVLVPNPGYPTYTSLSKLLGADVVPYDLKEEDIRTCLPVLPPHQNCTNSWWTSPDGGISSSSTITLTASSSTTIP